MAVDEHLVDRVRALLSQEPAVTRRKRFGCQAFPVNGNFACGAFTDRLIVRMDAGNYSTALEQPGVSEFDLTGRLSRGRVLVDQAVLQTEGDLQRWVEVGTRFARTLSAK